MATHDDVDDYDRGNDPNAMEQRCLKDMYNCNTRSAPSVAHLLSPVDDDDIPWLD